MDKCLQYLGVVFCLLTACVFLSLVIFRSQRRTQRAVPWLLCNYCLAICLGGVSGCGLLWGWQHRHAVVKHFHIFSTKQKPTATPTDFMYPVMTSDEQSALDNAIRLSFSGDLILLRDAAENGWMEERGEL